MPKHPRTPYVITRNFAVSHLLLKMRCIFFTEQSYTDQRFGCLCNPGLLKNCVFLCKGKKLKNSAKQNSWRVCRFSLWNSGAVSGFGLGLLVSRGFLGAKAGFGGFGLWLLIRNGFLGAKAFFAVVREGVADKPG